MISVDSSFLVHGLAAGSAEDRALREWLARGEVLSMSTIAWAEFECGPVSPQQLELAATFVTEREPFGAGDATRAAALFNASGRRRRTFVDCMIAAVAIRLGAPLATSNAADFRRLEPHGLKLAALGPRGAAIPPVTKS